MTGVSTAVAGRGPSVIGAALLWTVAATVVEGPYLQVEWHTTAVAPMTWWSVSAAGSAVGSLLLFLAVGAGFGRSGDRPQVRPAFGWYVVSIGAVLAVQWRYGPVHGLPPVRDVPEFVRLVLLPPPGLALTYGLALFPVLGWTVRRVPARLVLGAGVIVTVLTVAAVTCNAVFSTTADLAGHLLAFLAGWRLGRPAGTGPPHSAAGPLIVIGRAAVPITAVLVPVTAAVGAVTVQRLSDLDGWVQEPVAATGPALVTTAVVVAGLAGHRLAAR